MLNFRTNVLVTTWVSMALLTAAGCGIGKKSEETRDQIAQKWDLMGTYTNRCHAPNFLSALLKERYSKQTYEYNLANHFAQVSDYYADNACAQPTFTKNIAGTYQIVNDAPSIPEGKMVNLTVETATLTPTSGAGADQLNSAKYCGVNDWVSGTPKSIIDLDCGGLTVKTGQVVFDVYQQKDNTLYMGKKSFFANGSSADERPTELDTDLFYTKQ